MNTSTADISPSSISSVSVPVDEFPILDHGLYANHAAMGPWPRVASQAVAEFAEENSKIGPDKYALWLQREKQLRNNLAGLINAESADDIALLKNTTEGICTVANGIDWQSGDNLVLPMGEFPSNRLPWLALQQLGVEVREVDIRSTNAPEQALLAQMDQRTRLLSVSAVQWTDGLRLQLEILGQTALHASVDFLENVGMAQVEACITANSLALSEGLAVTPYAFHRISTRRVNLCWRYSTPLI